MNPIARHARQYAFTLIELLAVIGIMGILFAMALGIAGHVKRASQKATARAAVETLYDTIDEYRVEQGAYPGSNGVAPAAIVASLAPAVMARLPLDFSFTDPWRTPYQYERRSPYSCRVFSAGPDASCGTADDIGSDR